MKIVKAIIILVLVSLIPFLVMLAMGKLQLVKSDKYGIEFQWTPKVVVLTPATIPSTECPKKTLSFCYKESFPQERAKKVDRDEEVAPIANLEQFGLKLLTSRNNVAGPPSTQMVFIMSEKFMFPATSTTEAHTLYRTWIWEIPKRFQIHHPDTLLKGSDKNGEVRYELTAVSELAWKY